MKIYHCYERGGVKVEGSTEAMCECVAGWIKGNPAPQMHVGGWTANTIAMFKKQPQPPIDPTKAEAYYALCSDGDVVLSNFYEDRTDAYHAKQLVAALRPAQPKCLVFHYGFPSFDPTANRPEFWSRIKSLVDGTAASYYPQATDNPLDWSHEDYRRMAFQVHESRRFIGQSDKSLGFVISPQTHQGTDLTPTKLAKQVQFLDALGVEVLFMWSARGATPANIAAIKTALTKTATAFAASEQ